jgi:AcrR family transcriptional regulator
MSIDQMVGKREQGKVERKERLYEAALSLFRGQGYEMTTVDQITRQAGLAKGTFFNYFPTKDSVLRYMGAREVGRLGAATLSINGTASSIGKLKRLMSALAASLEREGVTVSDLMAGDAGGFSLQPMAALLIRQAQRQNEINPDLDPDALAAALDALYLQQLIRWCESSKPYPLAERLTGIADLLLSGITTR